MKKTKTHHTYCNLIEENVRHTIVYALVKGAHPPERELDGECSDYGSHPECDSCLMMHRYHGIQHFDNY